MMNCAVTYDASFGYRGLSQADKSQLRQLLEESVQFEVPMKRYTTFSIGGPADAVAMPGDVDSLGQLIRWANERGIPWYVVGSGSNLLVVDEGIRGIVIVLTPRFKGITRPESDADPLNLTVKAGTRLQTLCRTTIDQGWGDMTFAVGIPASVGGAILMNAGAADGCMADVLTSITVLWPTGKIESIQRSALDFGYRRLTLPDMGNTSVSGKGVIIEGTFKLYRMDSQHLEAKANRFKKERKKRQPNGVLSAGCFFKNPATGPTAGELIDKAGLKGKQVGGASVSLRHANFIINRKNARAADVLALAEYIETCVADTFGIYLEREVVILGDSNHASKSI